MLIILSGILAGFIHVVSGPDHVAAIAPIAVDQTRHRWKTGAVWGLGHTSGVWLVGIGALYLRDWLPVEMLSYTSERLVGVALIGIGLWAGRKAMRHTVHTHKHEHDGTEHTHIHVHARDTHRHTHTTGGIGLLHGIAGSSHLFGVLPALGLATATDTLTYLVAFGISSVIAMAGFTWFLGQVISRFEHRIDMHRLVLGGSAVVACVVGCVWLTL